MCRYIWFLCWVQQHWRRALMKMPFACFEPHSSKHPLNFRYVGTVLQFLTCPEPVPDWCHCQFCSKNHITPNHQADFYCVQHSPSLVCSGKESPVLTHLWDDSWAAWALKSLPVFFPPWVKTWTLPSFGLKDSAGDLKRWATLFKDIIGFIRL